MAHANPRPRDGHTKTTMMVSRPRPLPPRPATPNANPYTIEQSKYIMRHSHEAIVKKYQEEMYKLADYFERELRLKDETILNLHSEIAWLRRSATIPCERTTKIEIDYDEDANDRNDGTEFGRCSALILAILSIQ